MVCRFCGNKYYFVEIKVFPSCSENKLIIIFSDLCLCPSKEIYQLFSCPFSLVCPTIDRGDISLFVATSKRNNRCGREETERNLCCQVQKERWYGQGEALWSWCGERGRMWHLHGDKQQGRLAQLQSFIVYEMLSELVSKLLYSLYISFTTVSYWLKNLSLCPTDFFLKFFDRNTTRNICLYFLCRSTYFCIFNCISSEFESYP